jgi:hypothetical protein
LAQLKPASRWNLPFDDQVQEWPEWAPTCLPNKPALSGSKLSAPAAGYAFVSRPQSVWKSHRASQTLKIAGNGGAGLLPDAFCKAAGWSAQSIICSISLRSTCGNIKRLTAKVDPDS